MHLTFSVSSSSTPGTIQLKPAYQGKRVWRWPPTGIYHIIYYIYIHISWIILDDLFIYFIFICQYILIYFIHTWLSGKSSNLNLKWGFSSKPRLRTLARPEVLTRQERSVQEAKSRCSLFALNWELLGKLWSMLQCCVYNLPGFAEDCFSFSQWDIHYLGKICVYIHIY